MFFTYHRELQKRVGEIASARIILSCDLYGLNAARNAKRLSRRALLLYDARELYTGLPTVVGKRFTRHFWKRWESRGMLEADFLIVTAPNDADAIFRVHSFIPRPILIRNIPLAGTPVASRAVDLSRFKINSAQRVIVYVGGLQAGRGLESAIQSLKHLPADYRLLLLGDGAIRDTLESLASNEGVSERVVFGGAIPWNEVIPCLSSCDVGLSLIDPSTPSYELALPSKIFEYAAAGIPVVSTPLEHVREMFRTEPWIYYTELEPHRIAETIMRAVETRSDDLVKASLNQARQTFSFERDFEPFLKLLLDRLKER